MFDYYLAPYVSLSFVKHAARITKIKLDLSDERYRGLKECLIEYRKSIDDKRIMTDRSKIHKIELGEVIKEVLDSMDIKVGSKRIASILRDAYDETYDETFQSMEAFVHNLNTMHCLPASERIWVYDNKVAIEKGQRSFHEITMQELNDTFEEGRYKAISVNKNTGAVELKFITASKRMDNNRALTTICDELGRRVTVTDNHRVMTMVNTEKGTEKIAEDIPDNIESVIVARGISLNETDNTILNSIIAFNKLEHTRKEKIGEANESKRFKQISKSKIRERIKSNSGDEYVYDISVEDNENFMTYEGIFVHNSRAGRSTVYMVDVPVTWETLCPAV